MLSLAAFSIIIGLLELLVGIPLVLKPDAAAKWLMNVVKHDEIVRLTGAIFLVMAYLVLVPNWSIEPNTEGYLRLLAWIVGIKGLCLAWWPRKVAEMNERHLGVPALRLLFGFLAVFLGVVFLLAGKALM